MVEDGTLFSHIQLILDKKGFTLRLMPAEKEAVDLEKKSQFSGSNKEWLELIKIVVSMANTRGGTISIKKLVGAKLEDLDSSRIDDRVNKYIQLDMVHLEIVCRLNLS